MLIFAIYTLVIFHGLIVVPAVFVSPFILIFSKKNLKWLENVFIVAGGGTLLSYALLGSCFLTNWENTLREMVDPNLAYSGGFVSYYLGKIGINFPDTATTWTMAILSFMGIIAIAKRRKWLLK